MQIVKVIEKAEWPKYYVHVASGSRTRFFSKSDVPVQGYMLEADYEKAQTEPEQKPARKA